MWPGAPESSANSHGGRLRRREHSLCGTPEPDPGRGGEGPRRFGQGAPSPSLPAGMLTAEAAPRGQRNLTLQVPGPGHKTQLPFGEERGSKGPTPPFREAELRSDQLLGQIERAFPSEPQAGEFKSTPHSTPAVRVRAQGPEHRAAPSRDRLPTAGLGAAGAAASGWLHREPSWPRATGHGPWKEVRALEEVRHTGLWERRAQEAPSSSLQQTVPPLQPLTRSSWLPRRWESKVTGKDAETKGLVGGRRGPRQRLHWTPCPCQRQPPSDRRRAGLRERSPAPGPACLAPLQPPESQGLGDSACLSRGALAETAKRLLRPLPLQGG